MLMLSKRRKTQARTNRVMVFLAFLLGLAIHWLHHAAHKPNSTTSDLLDAAITTCGAFF